MAASPPPSKPSPKTIGPERTDKGRFAPGNGGRPKGIIPKKYKEIQETAHKILIGDAPEKYLENVRKRILRGEAPHMEKFFAEHLWGKPKEQIEHSGSVDLVHVLMDRLATAKERARDQRQLAS